jgi:hypothetical protein
MSNNVCEMFQTTQGFSVWPSFADFRGKSVRGSRGGVTVTAIPKVLLAFIQAGDYVVVKEGLCYRVRSVVLGQDQHLVFDSDRSTNRLLEELIMDKKPSKAVSNG